MFLRKQLAYYQERKIGPRRLTDAARVTLLLWSRFFDWKESLASVTPETFIRRHRKGFKFFWRGKSVAGDLHCRRKLSCGRFPPGSTTTSPQLGSCRVGDFLASNSTGTNRPAEEVGLRLLFQRRFFRWRSRVLKLNRLAIR